VVDVLRSPNLSLGPKVAQFEEAFARYVGRRHAVAVSSGTAGLFLSLTALEMGEGDEVITTPFTFIASATSIMMTGATPVFVDIDPVTLNIDTERIAGAVTDRTKAILPVDVFGSLAGLDAVCRIAEARGLVVVEDACEALGSALNGRKAGAFGRASVFGFYPNKQITTGEGGMICTDDADLAQTCVSLRNQGRGTTGRWLAHERFGYNFRLSDINCALGIVQLERIKQIKDARLQVATWYQEMLAADDRLIVPAEAAGCELSWFVFVVRLADSFGPAQRDRILTEMTRQGIQVGNYFPPAHLQPVVAQRHGCRRGDFPVAEAVSERTIALPFHNHLAAEDVALVCGALRGIMDTIL
jgi:perosamine synthetase